MKRMFHKLALAAMLPGLFSLAPCALADSEQSADQSAFQDDAELIQLSNSQVRQLEEQERNAEAAAAADDQRNQSFRLYAQKKVQELEKLKSGNAATDKQLQVMQTWLKADANMRLRDMQTIKSLRQRLANLEQTQGSTMQNLGNDVQAMRENAVDAKLDDRFNQQMQMNYYNEMQTEMGPASWTRSGNGTSYSMGGMGFNGGQNLFGGGGY